jgi:L-lactate dehydrogenase (cytochrome)
VIKGIQNVDDARRVVDEGADAVLLSNHGGRQLDRAPVPLELLPPTVQAVGGRAEVFVDTGIMHGADVVAAIAMGADAALVGRAYLYGLMAGGQQGVRKAVDILTGEIVRTLQLLGVTRIDDLRAEHARLRPIG